jgi:hypothetical protein
MLTELRPRLATSTPTGSPAGRYRTTDLGHFPLEKSPSYSLFIADLLFDPTRFDTPGRWFNDWSGVGVIVILMLSKCAESLALRKAFPHELSGLYTLQCPRHPRGIQALFP